MGVYVIKMPDIGEGIAEVELVEWHVKVGDDVVEDQLLADVMTDKATVPVPSPVHGTVLELGGRVGEVMAVGAALMRLEVEGEGNAATGAHRAPTPVESPEHAAPAADGAVKKGDVITRTETPDIDRVEQTSKENESAAVARTAASRSGAPSGGNTQPAVPSASRVAASVGSRRARPLASPAVRRRAQDEGVDLRAVPGSGPVGQITHEDLDRWLQGGRFQAEMQGSRPAASLSGVPREGIEEVPVVGLRRKIAQKMQDSKRHIPHFTYVEEVDVTELETLRTRLNERWGESRGRLTLLPFLARAMVLALRDFPQMNARYDDEKGVVFRHAPVHLGVATQTDAGLMVPVLRHAEAHDLWSSAREVRRLAEAVRSGAAQRDELSGSTITLTSLGPLGGIVSTPVINHPEVAIVGVNRVVERPVVRDGAIVVRKVMNLSSSFDHRVVDGMHAAEFIQSIRAMLECPSLLFVE